MDKFRSYQKEVYNGIYEELYNLYPLKCIKVGTVVKIWIFNNKLSLHTR